MFGAMRRYKQQLNDSEVQQILEQASSGVLAVLDKSGYPYAVPLSFVKVGNNLYFHSAKEGLKINAIKNCDKASFCIIDSDEVLPQKYTTKYKSVIAFGKITVVDGADEKIQAIFELGNKYYPNHDDELKTEINNYKNRFLILKLEIEQVTGKQGKEFLSQ